MMIIDKIVLNDYFRAYIGPYHKKSAPGIRNIMDIWRFYVFYS